ncbi:MAG: ATP-binding protein, partial [Sulfurovaceae bacterium]|nr:ATP-binding protein [Sulfurovaceae bacterium]
ITVLIGNNGSGKSNVLEAISIIFIELQKKDYAYGFNYKIEYEIDDKFIKIKQDDNDLVFYINEEVVTTLGKDKLPYKLIASYNGAVTRLWDLYRNSYFNVNRKKITTEENSILYIDLDELDIYLLVSLYNKIFDVYVANNDEEKESLQEEYNDFNVSIKINTYDKGLQRNENLLTFLNAISNENTITYLTLVDYFNSSLPNSKQEFLNYIFNCKFRKLVAEFENNEQSLLSEGEQHLKLLELVLDILAEQNTLILLDEPDSHIHVGNKKKITELIKKLTDIDNEVILTTHSPTLTHTFNDKHITMIKDGQIEDKSKQEMFSHITDGIWNYQEQSIFLSSQKDIILLVEGKHDKIHIEEAFSRLKDDYKDLDFDVFQMNGETNIKHMLLGLANNGVQFSGKKIIAIFDNDGAGKKGFGQNFKVVQGKEYKKLVDNNGNPSTIFFAFMLPKTDGFNEDFTIENMYSGKKNKEALNLAFNNRSNDNNFFNSFIDTVSKQIKED